AGRSAGAPARRESGARACGARANMAPHMHAHEQLEMLATLESGPKDLLNALAGVTEDLATRTPGPGRRSVLECVEHVAVSEDFLFSQIAASQRADMPVVNEKREAAIRARGLDRTMAIESPDVGRPKGHFSTLAAAVHHFVASRERTIRFVQNNREDLRSRLTSHPLIGVVNCYETLLMMALHPHRHAKQIEEIKAALLSDSAQLNKAEDPAGSSC